ncbi:MAG: hypothetical protein AUG02_06705 [Chloroflexi bacterium 13_1_20CM_2_70_9]|nr:MAG: hypothetical protein AUG02_06705 [Chloroflexi bacterium 13_1_20CM_2_70_9]
MAPAPPAPPTRREEVVDTVHGERLADPYRWLEDDGSDRVREWTDAQNARTRTVLDAIPQRAHFARRIGELLSVGLLETPRPIAGKIFHVRRAGAQKQHALYVRDAAGGTDAVAVDPNALDAMGLVTLDWWYPSWDGRYVAYGLSRGGDEMSTLQVRDLASGRDLEERIPDTQRCTVAWVDGGFYYTVHPAKGSVAPGDENYHRRVRFHRLGEPRDRDALVFGEGRPKEDILGVATSPGGRWALLAAWHGWRRNDLYLLDRGTGELRTVQEGVDGISTGIPFDDALWLRTNVGSPSYRVVRVAYERLAPDEWRTVVPECEHVVDAFDLTRETA